MLSTHKILYGSCVRYVIIPQVSFYLTPTNLSKIDNIKGESIKRSTVINKILS